MTEEYKCSKPECPYKNPELQPYSYRWVILEYIMYPARIAVPVAIMVTAAFTTGWLLIAVPITWRILAYCYWWLYEEWNHMDFICMGCKHISCIKWH